jgi:hypothetical protein
MLDENSTNAAKIQTIMMQVTGNTSKEVWQIGKYHVKQIQADYQTRDHMPEEETG